MLRSCFRSVASCLVDGAFFLFDLHTRKGLREWASYESAQREEEKVDCQGTYNPSTGRALMRFQGALEGKVFEQVITNRAYPLRKAKEWLLGDGF